MKAESIEFYINELNAITEKINSPDLTLDETLKLYKQGTLLAEKAKKLMNTYNEEIQILTDKEATDD